MTSNIADGAPAVNWEVPPEQRPPIRDGETYSTLQVLWRMNIGEKTLKQYEDEGLQPHIGSPTFNEATNKFWDGEDIRAFLKARGRKKG